MFYLHVMTALETGEAAVLAVEIALTAGTAPEDPPDADHVTSFPV